MGRSKKGVCEFAPPRRGLLVGNYCHDVLIRGGEVVAETLGGAASFISVVHAGFSIQCEYLSKVGSDFAYFDSLDHKPIVSSSASTTLFRAQFAASSDENGHSDRALKRVHACESIRDSDLPADTRFDFGLAVGVGGEILPETLQKMLDICHLVFADIQALIRSFDSDGTVTLIELKESGFFHLLPRLAFLKASSEEALKMDVEEVRRMCCLVVTNGKDGCTIYDKDSEIRIAPFSAVQVDPTGAGDSFLGGFAAGLVEGLSVADAALLGNLFGSLAVQCVGVPDLEPDFLQRINNEVQRRKSECNCVPKLNESKLAKPAGHEQFHLSLRAAVTGPAVNSPTQHSCTKDLPSVPRDSKVPFQDLQALLLRFESISAVNDHTTH